MPDERTRKWLRAAQRHTILESIALNALVTSLLFAVSSHLDELAAVFSRVNPQVEISRQALILVLVATVTLPVIVFAVVAVGRIGQNRQKLRALVAKEVRHTESELLATIHDRVAAKIRSEVAV
ncbi:MAG TPA: hypothetical protein VFJ16_11385 [Longimicrobium sp.]|nr:hypothetical protein [Longimicrobium sp.]